MRYRDGDLRTQELFDERIAGLAASRHGVFSLRQALELGASKRVVYRRLAAKRWRKLYPGVYQLNGTPVSWRSQLLAGCLASGGVASHRGAVPLWRLASSEQRLWEITVPRGRRPRLERIIVHQLPLPAVDVTVRDAIPVTTPARTLLDLAAVLPENVVEEALDDALRRGLVSIPRLRWRFEQLGKRKGSASIRRLLEARTATTGTPDSPLASRVLRLIRRRGLLEPLSQHPVRNGGSLVAVVDFAYPDAKLAIEADGYRWHSGRIRWQRDRSRRNELTRLGWRVIHVTADDVEHRPDEITDTIRAALGPGRAAS